MIGAVRTGTSIPDTKPQEDEGRMQFRQLCRVFKDPRDLQADKVPTSRQTGLEKSLCLTHFRSVGESALKRIVGGPVIGPQVRAFGFAQAGILLDPHSNAPALIYRG